MTASVIRVLLLPMKAPEAMIPIVTTVGLSAQMAITVRSAVNSTSVAMIAGTVPMARCTIGATTTETRATSRPQPK